ncbi:EAL domain-containing protein [Pullulanibacillus sp. KACC 23026]|uniref:EAL domain-containing protein n=1 Tax=Pullulanibacillus sp. KACC 23026 TaxID=3028315 RepID=UPI0023AF559D|nr:EAL domain-containing protein [Pullulanibacillus sp. KACC 23026]WEG12480.1 EAL domain-containing protein [Pullulanibacillus sp. KACC 23026]
MLIDHFIREEQFYHHFQPIYDIENWYLIGREVLLRSNEFSNPEIPFCLAKQKEKLYELDSRSIHKAISTYHMAGYSKREGKLFVNVYPSTISNGDFPSFIINIMNEFNVSRHQIVLELTETEKIKDLKQFQKIINLLRKSGILIALDDIGKGIEDTQRIIELNPDFIKLDKYFAHDLYMSKKKQDFVRFLQNYCDAYKTYLILEGIETPVDLAFAKSFGIKYGQGYALGKPDVLEKTV